MRKILIIEDNDALRYMISLRLKYAGFPTETVTGVNEAKEYLKKEAEGASFEELEAMTLGSLRRAVQEGDVKSGSLMAGQIAGMIKEERSCEDIIKSVVCGASRLMNGVSADE